MKLLLDESVGQRLRGKFLVRFQVQTTRQVAWAGRSNEDDVSRWSMDHCPK